VTVLTLLITPLTLTIIVGVVVDVTSNFPVIHLIIVEDKDTTSQVEPSEKVTE
jgi:hypothetical protein